MNVEELQRLIDEETFPYELNPEWEVVTNVKVVDAARLVANPERLEFMVANACASHDMQAGPFDMLSELDDDVAAAYRRFARKHIAAALTPGDTE